MGFLREIPSVGLCYGFDRRNRIVAAPRLVTLIPQMALRDAQILLD